MGGIAYVVGLAQNVVLLRASAKLVSEADGPFKPRRKPCKTSMPLPSGGEPAQARYVAMKPEVSETAQSWSLVTSSRRSLPRCTITRIVSAGS